MSASREVRGGVPRRAPRPVSSAPALALGLSLIALLPPGAALAQDDGADEIGRTTRDAVREPARRGFTRRPYVALGVGVTRLEPESPTQALAVSEEISAGGELGLGYDITRWLSGELYAADLGAADIDFLGDTVGDVGYRVYGLTAIVYLLGTRDALVPFSSGRNGVFRREGLSLFARAGVGGMSNESDLSYERDHTAHAVFGAGLEYGFRNGFALRAEVQAFDTDARYAGLSVLKRFGRVPVRAEAPVPVLPEPVTASPPVVVPAPPSPAPLASPVRVYFAFDVDTLSSAARDELDELADALVTNDGSNVDVDVAGHTDSLGSERYNRALSERRAAAVRDYLVSRGVAAERIDTRGFGESEPIGGNRTETARALNRRVEIGER